MAALLTAYIVLLPLLPAACIYWLLTPKAERGSNGNNAQGTANTNLGPTVFGIKFNVVGSTAFYFVLLLATAGIYAVVDTRQQSAFAEGTAWRVELPVSGSMIDATTKKPVEVALDDVSKSQLQVEIKPDYQFYGRKINFWVIRQQDRFPTIRLSIPYVSKTPELDLNDHQKVSINSEKRIITGVGTQWVLLRDPYTSNAATAPSPISAVKP
ncbi:hypothetical protein AWB79_07508 [Caballeronia hypogeia]|uniref:Uncharacterized protein n=1 Tax=Caballeronia hypogeia TaxID=1777140 RepID=A0A158DT10_9BURK|nr:hypothetical protein [Caballeronia hypogeia]SAK97725.1 hypothetical protein AWB79_07508 [Caballeronia hypogeia]